MVKISLSGSGGGCGRVTSRGYPTLNPRRTRARHGSHPSWSGASANVSRSTSGGSRGRESIAINLSEGRLRHAGDKKRHFKMAAGSASEVTTALRITVAKRYISPAELAEIDAVLDRVRAMLFRITPRRLTK